MKVEIYHNPRCTKSRETLKLIQLKGIEPTITEYLKNPPSKQKLEAIIEALGISADKIVRQGESVYKENYKGKSFNNKQWIDILIKNPILLERPIVVTSKGAAIGRPPENVLKILA